MNNQGKISRSYRSTTYQTIFVVAIYLLIAGTAVGVTYTIFGTHLGILGSMVPPPASASNTQQTQATFIESTLPRGTLFTVTYDNVVRSETVTGASSSLVFTVPTAGTYPYSISTAAYGQNTYSPTVASGTLSSGQTLNVQYALTRSISTTTTITTRTTSVITTARSTGPSTASTTSSTSTLLPTTTTIASIPGKIGSVSVSISNPTSLPAPSGFQQLISFNPSASGYSSYLSSNLGNIRFYQGSNELYSWCESGCSASSTNAFFWVKLPSGIAASANIAINMTFLSTSTNYDGVYAGEMSQSSYDNGAKVFNYYNNGNTVGGLTATQVGSLSLSTQIGPYGNLTTVIAVGGGGSGTAAGYNYQSAMITNALPSNFIMEGWTNAGANYNSGFTIRSPSTAASNCNAYIMSNGWNNAGAGVGLQSQSSGCSAVTDLLSSDTMIFGWVWMRASASGNYLNTSLYLTPEGRVYSSASAFNSSLPVTNSYLGINAYSGTASPAYYMGLRVRQYPPKGIMPSVTFSPLGVATATTSIPASGSSSFTESGLPTAATFNVIYNSVSKSIAVSPSSTQIAFTNAAAGNYPYSIRPSTYGGVSYLPSTSNGFLATDSATKITFTSNQLVSSALSAKQLTAINGFILPNITASGYSISNFSVIGSSSYEGGTAVLVNCDIYSTTPGTCIIEFDFSSSGTLLNYSTYT